MIYSRYDGRILPFKLLRLSKKTVSGLKCWEGARLKDILRQFVSYSEN
jgi:hypothetical protein